MKYKLFLLSALIIVYFFSSVFTAFSQNLPAPLRLQLASSKSFYNRTDMFQLDIALLNSDPKPIRVDIVLQIYDRLGLREGLETPPLYRKSWRRYYVPPGGANLKFVKSISSLKLSEGAYPVRVFVLQRGVEVAQARTTLAIVDEHALEDYRPLGVILVWPLHERARFNHKGIFVDNKIVEDSNTDINNPGVYYRHLTALAQYPSIQITMAATPILIEQMAEMRKGYRVLRNGKVELKTGEAKEVKDVATVFDRYSELFSSEQMALLSTPYAFTSLPLLADSGWDRDARLQVVKGREAIMETFELDSLAPSIYLPGLSLTSDSIAYLAKEGIENTILSGKTFKRIISAEEGDIYNSYRVQDTENNRITVIFRDDIASEAIGLEESEEATRGLMGRLAEIYLNNPGKQKIVAVVAEPGEQPSREKLENLYRNLQQATWIKTITLEDGIRLAPPSSRPLMMLDIPIEDNYISVQYRKRLGSSRKAYEMFAQVVESSNPILKKLERELLISEGWDWTHSSDLSTVNLGLDFVENIERVVKTELGKVRILSQGSIALSTLSGKIPIAVFNKADYSFRMIVKVESDNFSFSKGSSQMVELKPKENILSFNVTAYGPGTFPLKASILSDSDVVDQETFTIKAMSFTRTFFFVSVLLIAAIFLYFIIRFYVRRFKH